LGSALLLFAIYLDSVLSIGKRKGTMGGCVSGERNRGKVPLEVGTLVDLREDDVVVGEGGVFHETARSHQRDSLPRLDMDFDTLLVEFFAARDRFYEKFQAKGYELRDNVMAKLIDPSLFGAPSWPNFRQAHRCLLKQKRVIVISDGLSDPFPPGELEEEEVDIEFANVGFGFEVFAEFEMESHDVSRRFTEEQWVCTWEALLIDYITQNLAVRGRDFLPLFESMEEVMSLEVPEEVLPQHTPPAILNDRGTLGVLIYRSECKSIEPVVRLPCGKAKLIALKFLNKDELQSILDAHSQDEATEIRLALARKFRNNEEHHVNFV